MPGSKQSKRCDGSVNQNWSQNDNPQQCACDLFEYSERMFGRFNLTDANVSVRISQHEVVKVTISFGDTFSVPRRWKRGRTTVEPIIPVRAMSTHKPRLAHRPDEMTKIFKKRFSRLLRYCIIDHGEFTFVLVSGKVRRIVPAPSIMNKTKEIALLARLFTCCERPA